MPDNPSPAQKERVLQAEGRRMLQHVKKGRIYSFSMWQESSYPLKN